VLRSIEPENKRRANFWRVVMVGLPLVIFLR